ncbi:MAG: CBS domain-containing protein [Thermoplasmatales archaeon]|nr:MAG: CBS domain-containing protein [Thermoplasmatales archaeon]
MKIKDIMTRDIIYVDKDEDLKHVLDLMKKHNITKIPVVENKKLCGIVTDNIIAYKLGSIRKRGVSTSRLHASSVTEKEISAISPNADVKTILKTVGQPGPTMLPVVDNDKLVGVITKADLLPLVDSKKSLKSLMKTAVNSVSPDDRVVHARRIMIDEDVARLPVIDQGKLVGIISDFEIAYAFALLKRSFSLGHQKHQLDELLVKDVMKSPVIWTMPSTTAADAAKLMLKYNIGALPILKDNNLVGIVTRTDLLKTMS